MANQSTATRALARSYISCLMTIQLLDQHLESGGEAEDHDWVMHDATAAKRWLDDLRNELPVRSPAWPFVKRIFDEINSALTGDGAYWDRAEDMASAHGHLEEMVAAISKSRAYRAAVALSDEVSPPWWGGNTAAIAKASA